MIAMIQKIRKLMVGHFDHRWDDHMKNLNRRAIFLAIVIAGASIFYQYLDVFDGVPQILKISELGYSNEVVTQKVCFKNSLGTKIYQLKMEGVKSDTSSRISISITFNEFMENSYTFITLLENLNNSAQSDNQEIYINWKNVEEYFVKLDAIIWNSDLAYAEKKLTDEPESNTVFMLKNNRILIIKIDGVFEYNKTNIDILSKLMDLDYSFIK